MARAAFVETARGPVPTERLGWTLMHEHVFIFDPDIAQNYETGWEEEKAVSAAVDRLNELAEAGFGTLVDLTVVGLGRNVERIARVAAQTHLNIVVATGLYTFNDLPHYFAYRGLMRRPGDPDLMTEMFVGDITKGVRDTGVKAAILKCATDEAGVTPGVERVLRAVAQAHRATGVPISTHTHAGTRRGLDQQDIFEAEGVDLARVVIGHSGDSTDLDYLQELMRRGSFIGMDRFGAEPLLPFDDRVRVVAELCRRGWSGQMVLSHDFACHNDWFDPQWVALTHPRWSYLHIVRDVLPALRDQGVVEQDIQRMMVDNPRRILASSGLAM